MNSSRAFKIIHKLTAHLQKEMGFKFDEKKLVEKENRSSLFPIFQALISKHRFEV
jgi:hypothetical protein